MVNISKHDEPTDGVWSGLFWLLDRYNPIDSTGFEA